MRKREKERNVSYKKKNKDGSIQEKP